jgi:hypothetical protein
MSDLSNASTFVPVATINNSSTTASVLQTVDFASYSGSGRYIAFRNVLASGQSGDYSCNYIDDITLELRPASCPAISAADLPYSDNFDSYTTSTTAKTGVSPDCWTLAHQDVTMTDEYKPMVYYANANAHSGNYSLILNKRGIYAMPEFDGDVSTLQLSFYVKQSAAKYQLQVGVMSDLSNASTFVPVATINNSSTTASVLQTVDFASYSGSGRYIAFRNVLASGYSGDFSLNYIDDISLELRPASCPAISTADLPYSDNFDSYTTSTTAKTGVAPDCWTLAHQDVTMTDEYKPMVYYASANAHSGNYSLILNKRGIYAMPEFDGDVSTLQLSFYVKQSAAKYQLQVGVMSDLSNASTFVPVATINNSSTTASVLQSVDFASYSGSGRYIAFRNILASGYSGDFSLNYIDDISLELRPASCPAISASDLPYSDNFDSYTTSTTAKTGVSVPCWTLAHQDVAMADEYKPMVYYSSANAHSGSYSLILNKRGIFAMPEFDGDVSTLQLSFYVRQPQTKFRLQVGVMSDLSNAGTFVPVATINNSSTTASVLQTVDFASYSGSGRYIAFRNVLASGYSGDFSLNYIDDISLELRPSSCPAISTADLPYSDNFDSYTTSTTAKTGVAPDCWTLAHQDVAMADEYMPMVYHDASCAHSGSYSLILNKRGIFAMPEFDGDVSTLQLSFYVRQTQAKFRLQVGVMSDLSNAGSFVPVATINNSSTSASVLQTIDFASYSGSGRYIAFRNILASGYSGDFSCNYIDDIRLETRCAIYPDELPYSDNFDSYTTSTTAKTGVSVPCWTLAHQDVAMTDEYKPMVYYSSAQAHSGSYSIILNKRCIFAMPQYLGNVRDLQLTFYLCQTQAKYQLQVGVMSDLSNASTFVPVATFNNSSTTASVLRTVNFSAYTGSGHYIAFRNVLASGQTGDYSCNYIDDITLSLAASKGLDGNGNDVSGNEPLSQKWMTVFPNPTSGMITIEADGEIERIDIFDYTGRCVATVEHQTSVDLSRFASGLYTLRCTLPDRIEVRRVVKQ